MCAGQGPVGSHYSLVMAMVMGLPQWGQTCVGAAWGVSSLKNSATGQPMTAAMVRRVATVGLLLMLFESAPLVIGSGFHSCATFSMV